MVKTSPATWIGCETLSNQASCQVPDMYDDYITDKVLTMEYCPSTKISDVEKISELGLDRAKLAER